MLPTDNGIATDSAYGNAYCFDMNDSLNIQANVINVSDCIDREIRW